MIFRTDKNNKIEKYRCHFCKKKFVKSEMTIYFLNVSSGQIVGMYIVGNPEPPNVKKLYVCNNFKCINKLTSKYM